MSSDEANRFGGRVKRYAQVGTGVGGLAVRFAGSRLLGLEPKNDKDAQELKAALGGLKGPLMKVAQMLATIPEVLPEEYAEELAQLQNSAPPMGWPFVRRRMKAELGADWQSKFTSFEREAAAAASLGQVHKAVHPDGRALACKLQYPDMQSAVEADLKQLSLILSIHRRFDTAIDTSEIAMEVGDRLREELDYELEAKHMRLYRSVLAPFERICVPEVVEELSTPRHLAMTWLDGHSVLKIKDQPLDVRNRIAETIYQAWWHPFSHYGAIHGDPHLGNYTVWPDNNGLNLLDFGCIRIFSPQFVAGVVDLYRAIETGDRDLMVAGYERWGFRDLSNEMIDVLNVWAEFIYGPLLDDRVRSIADGLKPSEYGRKEAMLVHSELRRLGPVKPPREFVFMDRAAIGLGAVFLHLDCRLNFYQLFNRSIDNFAIDRLAQQQERALTAAGLTAPHAHL